MITPGSPHVGCTPMGHTCGRPNEIDLAAIRVKSNASRHVRSPPPSTRRMVLERVRTQPPARVARGGVAKECRLPPVTNLAPPGVVSVPPVAAVAARTGNRLL